MNRCQLVFTAFALALAAAPPALAAAGVGDAIVVMGIQGQYDSSKRALLNELILTEVQKAARGTRVLAPSDLEALLDVEKMRDAMGCDDVRCAAEIGGALGAQRIITGQVGKLGDSVILTLKLIDVGKTEVAARTRGSIDASDEAKLLGLIEKLVGDLGLSPQGGLGVRSPPPANNPPNAEAPKTSTIFGPGANGAAAGSIASTRVPPPPPVKQLEKPDNRLQGWIMFGASIALFAGSLYYDLRADSSNNGHFDKRDLIPVAGYSFGFTGVIWGLADVMQ